MPYLSLKDLPKSVQDHLPKHAQEIYKEAVDHKVAWTAVKSKYEKRANHWVAKIMH